MQEKRPRLTETTFQLLLILTLIQNVDEDTRTLTKVWFYFYIFWIFAKTNIFKGVQVSDEEIDETDKAVQANGNGVSSKLQKEQQELEKINTGMSKVILKDLKERQKYKAWKQQNMDPRNASRTPNASKEPVYKLRFAFYKFQIKKCLI